MARTLFTYRWNHIRNWYDVTLVATGTVVFHTEDVDVARRYVSTNGKSRGK